MKNFDYSNFWADAGDLRDMLILATVDQPTIGYEIVRKTKVATGTVYGILDRLVEKGFLKAEKGGDKNLELYSRTNEGTIYVQKYFKRLVPFLNILSKNS